MPRFRNVCMSADENMPNLSNLRYHDAAPRRLNVQDLPSTPPLMPLNCYGGLPSVMAQEPMTTGVPAAAGELQNLILRQSLRRLGWRCIQSMGFTPVQRQITNGQPAARMYLQHAIMQRYIFKDVPGRLISSADPPTLAVALCIDAKQTLMHAVECGARNRRGCGGRCQFCYQDAVEHVYRFTHRSLPYTGFERIMSAISQYNTFRGWDSEEVHSSCHFMLAHCSHSFNTLTAVPTAMGAQQPVSGVTIAGLPRIQPQRISPEDVLDHYKQQAERDGFMIQLVIMSLSSHPDTHHLAGQLQSYITRMKSAIENVLQKLHDQERELRCLEDSVSQASHRCRQYLATSSQH